MAAMKTVLALTTIFLIHQCIHFWGASTAQRGDTKPERLRFNTAEEVSILKKNGNFNNIRICNGKVPQVLADEHGVLAVMCPRNNGNNVKPPVGSFNYTLIVEVPRQTSDHDGTDPNGGITTLVEIEGQRDPNVTVIVSEESESITVGNVGANLGIIFYN